MWCSIPSLAGAGRVGIVFSRQYTLLCVSLCILQRVLKPRSQTNLWIFLVWNTCCVFLYRHAQGYVVAMSVYCSLSCADHDLNLLARVFLGSLLPQDAIVEGSFDEEACRVQAHGIGQL